LLHVDWTLQTASTWNSGTTRRVMLLRPSWTSQFCKGQLRFLQTCRLSILNLIKTILCSSLRVFPFHCIISRRTG
jgi:hypothetical protein